MKIGKLGSDSHRERIMAGLASLSCETNLAIQSVYAIAVKGHWKSLLNPKVDCSLSTTTIHQLLIFLSIYNYGPSRSWTFFQWVESIPNYKHSLQSSWTMIHILTKHKHYQTARDLLEKISRKDFLSSPSVLSALVGTHNDPDVNSHVLSWLIIFYAKSKMTQEAIQVFEHMRLCKFKPHLHACTVVLNSLAKERLTSMVWKVFKNMTRIGIVPNLHIYNVLIHACCKSGDVEKAEKLLSEMESNSFLPDLFTYNTLISLYSKKGMHYEAFCVQDRMERGGVSPDIVTYNSLIYGLCREGKMREAVRLFREIKGDMVNHVTYTTLIDGYCRVNDLDEALRLWEVMEARGLTPGVVTYNSILRKLCEEGRIREANKLLNEMGEKKVEADNITCNTLVNAYCKIGDMSSASKVKIKMLDAGLKLDSFTYKALIHGFCKIKEREKAKELLCHMLDAGYAPGYCTYSWLVDAYCDQENAESVIVLLEEFLRSGTCVEVSICRAFIRRLCKRGKIDLAEKIFKMMHEKGIVGDSVVCITLAYAYWRGGKYSAASEMLNEMFNRRFMVNLKLYRCISASYGDDKMVLSLFWDHLVERGLMFKSIIKEFQQMKPVS